MIKEIDGIPVEADAALPDGELLSYVQRGMEKYGRAFISVEVKITCLNFGSPIIS